MVASMNLIAQKCFHKANRVTDSFHVQKQASQEALEIRILQMKSSRRIK